MNCNLAGVSIDWVKADVKVSNIRISDTDNTLMLDIESVGVDVDWQDIITGVIDVNLFNIDGLVLRLNQQKNNNKDKVTSNTSSSPENTLFSAISNLPAFNIQHIKLNNSTVNNNDINITINDMSFTNLVKDSNGLQTEYDARFSINEQALQLSLFVTMNTREKSITTNVNKLYAKLNTHQLDPALLSDLPELSSEILFDGEIGVTDLSRFSIKDANLDLTSFTYRESELDVKFDQLSITKANSTLALSKQMQLEHLTTLFDSQLINFSSQYQTHNIAGQSLALTATSIEISAEETDVQIDKMQLNRLSGQVSLPNGENDVNDNGSQQTTKPSQSKDSNFKLLINEVVSDGLSRMQVVDPSLSKLITHYLAFDNIKASHLNNFSEPFHFSFNTYLDDTNVIESTISQELPGTLSVNTDIVRLSLPMFSPYIEQALGKEMKSGNFDGNLHVNLSSDETTGELTGKLIGLELTSPQGENESAISTFSINTLLNQLKDSGEIEINLPFRFTPQDSSVSLNSLLSLLGKRIANHMAKQYLADTLLPYSTVVKLVITNSAELFKVRFEPLLFDSQQWQLSAAQMEKLSVLSEYLNNNETQITVCPYMSAVEQNNTVTFEVEKGKSNLTLAEARLKVIRDYLVNQGINLNRLVACQSTVVNDDSNSRVEFKAL